MARCLQVLRGISVSETWTPDGQIQHRLRLRFFPPDVYPDDAELTVADVLHAFKTEFMTRLTVSCGA